MPAFQADKFKTKILSFGIYTLVKNDPIMLEGLIDASKSTPAMEMRLKASNLSTEGAALGIKTLVRR